MILLSVVNMYITKIIYHFFKIDEINSLLCVNRNVSTLSTFGIIDTNNPEFGIPKANISL